MCGRFNFDFTDKDEVISRFHIVKDLKGELRPNYNVAPSQEFPVVVTHSPNSLEVMLWGLIAFWEKSEKPHGLINVRDDTILTKPWAHKYIQFQRCIVPCSGFFEFKGPKGSKIPYNFRLKDEKLFGLAGMYSEWKHPRTAEVKKTFTIITTTPNSLMEPIHNRMPVILHKKDEEEWLNPDMSEMEQIKEFLKPYPAKEMESYPVSTRINSPFNNSKDLLQPSRDENKDKIISPANSK